MLRSSLIYLSRTPWARRAVTGMPIAWRTASRFVAGETLEDAIQTVKELNGRGNYATLDVLGEHTTNPEEGTNATRSILAVLDAIDREELASNVSIKLTQIGLGLDINLCAENLACLLQRAKSYGIFVRIDMEDSPWVDDTLKLFREMQRRNGFENVGVVIQSYLYRSRDDMRLLMENGARVRLCKGAYQEPPEVAYPAKSDVDDSYDRLAEMLINGAIAHDSPVASPDGKIPPIPAIATHDVARIEHAKAYARKAGLAKQSLEFQMLHGIRRELQQSLLKEGYPVRVYVPFGTEWYPYLMRRLAERPANLWFFLSNFFRR